MTEPNLITQALLSAIRLSGQPMVLTDPNLPDHPMIAVNTAFEALTGYSAAETVGRNCRFLQGADTAPQTPGRIGSCIAERRGCIEWIVNYRKNGEKFWNLLFISPVFDRAGRLLHYFGNQRDITEGPPATLPDYTIGRADMSELGRLEFNALLQVMLEEGAPGESAVLVLERAVEAARRLDDVTTRLAPAEWAPPVR